MATEPKKRKVGTRAAAAAAAAAAENYEEREDEEDEKDVGKDVIERVTDVRFRIETNLFFIGLYPYKVTLQMGDAQIIPLSVVKAVAADQSVVLPVLLTKGDPAQPSHPGGHFVVFPDHVNGRQYGFFKYDTSVGCSVVSSRNHENYLRPPRVRHRKISSTIKVRVGSMFLYDEDLEYEFDADGTVSIGMNIAVVSSDRIDQSEDQRRFVMMARLRDTLPDDYKITTVHNSDHFCPFSGGGDIWIHKDSVVVISDGGTEDHSRDEVEDDGSCSPRAKVEHKLVAGINESQKLAVTAQLQANMFLTAAHFMKVRLATHPSAAQSIESVTTYGVQVGIVCPIKILKLTLDFCQGSALFEELFSKDRCPISHVVIDMAIGHLLSCV